LVALADVYVNFTYTASVLDEVVRWTARCSTQTMSDTYGISKHHLVCVVQTLGEQNMRLVECFDMRSSACSAEARRVGDAD